MFETAIENAAREYVEIIWSGGEPVTSAEAIFEHMVGRKPTSDESKRITERINELLEGFRKGKSKP